MCVSHYTQPISKETKFAELFIFYIVSKGEDRVLEHAPNFLNRFMGALQNSYNII